MFISTPLRILRMRHRVTLSELAQEAGVSIQQVSRLELGEVTGTKYQEEKIASAWASLIRRRRTALVQMEKDGLSYSGGFLKRVEVGRDEL